MSSRRGDHLYEPYSSRCQQQRQRHLSSANSQSVRTDPGIRGDSGQRGRWRARRRSCGWARGKRTAVDFDVDLQLTLTSLASFGLHSGSRGVTPQDPELLHSGPWVPCFLRVHMGPSEHHHLSARRKTRTQGDEVPGRWRYQHDRASESAILAWRRLDGREREDLIVEQDHKTRQNYHDHRFRGASRSVTERDDDGC